MADLQIEGGSLSYDIAGSGDPVVLLHGGAVDRTTWDAEFSALSATHTVIRYDARGHGRSSTPDAPFSHWEDLRQLLDGLGVDRASLVGLSQGGRTSVDFAISLPDRVDKLLLVAPGVSGMAFHDPFVLDHMARIGSAKDLGTIIECILRMWVDGPLRSPEDVPYRARCRSIMAEGFARHGNWQRHYTEIGVISRLGELRAPTLALVGDLDSADIRHVVDLIVKDAPHAHMRVVEGAGHMINLDQPEEFGRILLRYLGH
ncbi:hydrolase [Lentzea sp. NBRC 105346]|uniref:alpha/beta fold hydrolase n=1 Tax=Lentzea sp. NBRC 105346 TaxID=3032205 RepID=UPI0024A53EB6|nr:alpha/beta fold hydrolase [Lentzea sp. NBRC 105346]GLZ28296.1 hydrolase [Lentzea sp. NBRC 105346]